MAIAIGGIVALGLQDWHIASFKLHGDLAALLASLSFSIYLIVLERLESQLHLTTILLWSSAIAAGLTFPLVLFSSSNSKFRTSLRHFSRSRFPKEA